MLDIAYTMNLTSTSKSSDLDLPNPWSEATQYVMHVGYEILNPRKFIISSNTKQIQESSSFPGTFLRKYGFY